VKRGACLLATGNSQVKSGHTEQIFGFSVEPNALAQPHHIFDFVLSWACVSSPMTASSMRGKFNPKSEVELKPCLFSIRLPPHSFA
jgi:hypothetical protein